VLTDALVVDVDAAVLGTTDVAGVVVDADAVELVVLALVVVEVVVACAPRGDPLDPAARMSIASAATTAIARAAAGTRPSRSGRRDRRRRTEVIPAAWPIRWPTTTTLAVAGRCRSTQQTGRA